MVSYIYMVLIVSFILLYTISASDDKINVAFVIDDTASMKTVINKVISKTQEMFKAIYDSKTSRIGDFILITFNDIEYLANGKVVNNFDVDAIPIRAQTSDSSTFLGRLNEIVVHGGGSCPELCLRGIYKALEQCNPLSFIYVFTDASPRDYHLEETIKYLARQKSIQINFLIAAPPVWCPLNDTVYKRIGTATSGDIFQVIGSDVDKVISFLTFSVRNPQTLLMQSPIASGISNLTITADSDMNNLSILSNVIPGCFVDMTVIGPDGQEVNTPNLVNTLNTQGVLIAKPTNGSYLAIVNTNGTGQATVRAKVSVDFKHGFSTEKPTTLTDTRYDPVPGLDSYLLIQLTITGTADAKLKSIQLVDMDDKELKNITADVTNEEEKIYVSASFKPPSNTFKIVITVVDLKTNELFTRKSRVPVQPQKIRKSQYIRPVVTIENGTKIVAKYGDNIKLLCKVKAYPKPIIVWEDEEAGLVIPSTVSILKLPDEFISVLEINNIAKDASYKCKATSNSNEIIMASIKVETIREHFLKVIEFPKDTTIDYEKDGKLYCKVDAWPPGRIEWYKNDKQLAKDDNSEISASNDTLLIRKMLPELDGLYSCKVSNDDSSETFKFTLSVSGLENPVIDHSESTKTVTGGTNAIISCRITKGVPEPQISWTFKKDGTKDFISMPETEQKIQIDSAYLNNAGVYRCVAKNIVGEDAHETEVIVQYPPVIDKSTRTNNVVLGTKAILECRITKGVPEPQISWTFKKDGTQDFITMPETEQKIQIDSANLNNAGVYRCVAKNIVGEDAHETEVIVQYPPVIDKSTRTNNVVMGTKAILECRITEGVPEPQISWTFKKDGTKDFISMPETEQKIQIDSAYLNNAGVYRCVAKNIVGEDAHETEVIVQYPPVIDKSTRTNSVVLGTKAVLECRILEGLPKPTITWEFKRQKAKEFVALPETDAEVQIGAVELDDAGVYKCYAKNKLGEDFHKIVLSVQVQPTVTVNETVTAKIGDTVLLTCDVTGEPYPEVEWNKNGAIIKNYEKYKTFSDNSLWFVADLDDWGIYTCTARNILGEESKKVTVHVYDPVKIKPPTESKLYVDVGEDVVLLCKASGYPKPRISWHFYSSDPLIKSQVLPSRRKAYAITKILEDRAGFYICIAKNYYSSANITYEVFINAPVYIEKPSQKEFDIVENDNVLSIPCKAKGFPKPKISWTKDYNVLEMGDSYTTDLDGTLIIHNPDELSAGKYMCVADNGVTDDLQVFTVKFTSIPIPGEPTETVYVEEDTSTEIECKLPQKPTDTVRWYTNGAIIPLPTNQLILRHARVSDSGVYSCRVTSSLGSQTAHLQITVGSKPSFENKRDSETIAPFIRGRSACLDCYAKGTPTPTITWWHNDIKLEERSPLYEISKLNETHLGDIRCEAKNELGSITRTYVFKVIGCAINYNEKGDNKFHPILIPRLGSLAEYENDNGIMILPENDPIYFICPNNIRSYYCSKNKFNSMNNLVPANSRRITYADLKCSSEVEPTTREYSLFGMGCANDRESKLVQVGYEFKASFNRLYDVCFNPRTKRLYFTNHNVNRYASNIKIDSHPFISSHMNYNYEEMFDCDKQSSIAGAGCCFLGRQLVSPLDVAPGVQKATYFDINVSPQWNFCGNNVNSNEIEERIRDLAKSISYKLEVFSGEYGSQSYSFLKDHYGNHKTAPKYIWKVAKIPQIGQALAIVTINVPNLTKERASELVFCKDICDETDWMKNPDWRRVSYGYTFCCDPWEFAGKLNPIYRRLFGSNIILSKNI